MERRKKQKFSFSELKAAATSANPSIRKKVFEEYFEMFGEFPSYLFDNTEKIDETLAETIRDIQNDPNTHESIKKGIAMLLHRLPSNA